jgi:hypothetical protein
MNRRYAVGTLVVAAVGLGLGSAAQAAGASSNSLPITYTAGTPSLDTVTGGPWTLGQGDPTVGAPYNRSLPTYQPGGSPTITVGGVTYPNLSVYPGGAAASSGQTGIPGPLSGYCSSGGPNPESGTPVRQPAGTTLPMQPYYFPFVTQGPHGTLLGYFDWRPKDTNEAVVAASSSDGGHSWQFLGQALEQNPGVCANGNTDDDGQGHPVVISIPGRSKGGAPSFLYTVPRPTFDHLGSQLIVHQLTPQGGNPLAGLPATESVGRGGSTTATAPVTIPPGPGGPGGTGGVTLTVANTTNFEMPGRMHVDGAVAYCVDGPTATTFVNCTTTNTTPLAVSAGDAVTADPVVPVGALSTTGLISPDGIVGVLPRYAGAPNRSTSILYTEKLAGFYAPTTTTAAVTLPQATIPIAAFGSFASDHGVIDISLGTSNDGIQSVTCTGQTATSLTGCSGGLGTVPSGSQVGAPGACAASSSELGLIGEGSTSNKKLFGNNEDFTQLRAAYTTDGIHFTDLGAVAGVQDPNSTDNTTLRFVASRGSVIANSDGSETMFLSGGYCSDGDSDAFNHIFTSTSRDGHNWSTPASLIGTDYTFAASHAQAGTGNPLAISAYYSGRTYSPAVVRGRNGQLTMVFAGYRTPKPLPKVGTALGTDLANQYVVGATDPALYRNILTVTLTPSKPHGSSGGVRSSGGGTLSVGMLLGGAAEVLRRRGRRRIAA